MVFLWFSCGLPPAPQDVKTEYPEDEDPEASVAWAETVSASEQAALLKANAQELDAAQRLGELGMVLWY
jgi:hypothetical protein